MNYSYGQTEREQMITRQFTFFIGVGILSAIVDIATMQIVIILGFHYSGAVLLGFMLGLAVNYICHVRVTFNAASSVSQAIRFGVVVFMNYLITMACVTVSQHMLNNVLVGKLVSLPAVAVNGFLWSRYWVFK